MLMALVQNGIKVGKYRNSVFCCKVHLGEGEGEGCEVSGIIGTSNGLV